GGIPAGRSVLLTRLPALGLAPIILHRRTAGTPRLVCALEGVGIGGLATLARGILEESGSRTGAESGNLLVYHSAHGLDERRLPWNAGPLSDIAKEGLGVPDPHGRWDHGDLDDRCPHRRRPVRASVRPHWPPPHDRHCVGRGAAAHPALGLRTERLAAGAGRILDAGNGARRLGRDPRPHHGAVPRRCP